MKNVRGVILGAPGSGKGTQCSWMYKDFGVTPISTGEILRRHVNENTEVGREVQDTIRNGNFACDQTVFKLINEYLCDKSSWLLDGYPRTVTQAAMLDDHLQAKNIKLDFVLNIEVPEQVIIDRITERWVHIPSGRTYHTKFNPPKIHGIDDVTGEFLVKRPDDNIAVVKKRLEDYKAKTLPVVNYYMSKGVCKTFNGSDSKAIYSELKSFLQQNCQTAMKL